jgi:hypothetical protein
LLEFGKKPLKRKSENGGEKEKMNVNSIKSKKSLKIITLLITAAFIATVSATTYNYMYQIGNISVEGLDLTWTITGAADATEAGTSITGSTVTLADLVGPAGGTKTYSDPVRLTAAADTTFNLNIASVSGDTGQMTSIIVVIYDITDDVTPVDTLTVWSSGSTGSDITGLSILTGATWRFQWEISWANGASGTVDVQLDVEIPST